MDSSFIARMEQILYLYALPTDERYPLVCFDERPFWTNARIGLLF
jgi:hypothetical protein